MAKKKSYEKKKDVVKEAVLKVENQTFETRCADLMKEVDPLFKKYGVMIGAEIIVTPNGIFPNPKLLDADRLPTAPGILPKAQTVDIIEPNSAREVFESNPEATIEDMVK